MRFAILALVLLFAVAACASQSFNNVVPDKHDPGINPPPGKFQGGDTIATCTVIGGLPYDTVGTTAGYVHNYDEVCPYSGSTSPDVVYCWTADITGAVDIETCNSGYDTKLYVYENVYTPGAYYACNDDDAECDGPAYRSWIHQMPVTMGNIYYIVVDGYGGDFGAYEFHVREVEGPVECDPYACPPGAFLENEPVCGPNYVDGTNVGCNGTAGYIFQYPPFPTAICGTSGNYDYFGSAYRDMDWFGVQHPHPHEPRGLHVRGVPGPRVDSRRQRRLRRRVRDRDRRRDARLQVHRRGRRHPAGHLLRHLLD